MMITRRWLFRYAWGIALAVVLAILIGVLVLPVKNLESVVVGTIALGLGFCYFAQKQNHDEIQLFKELFTEFNCRYSKMNDDLDDILHGTPKDEGSVRKQLVEYFNLCAEEYLFYQEGYIHRVVWRAWCRGMREYLKSPRIKSEWDREIDGQETNSYYGLSLAEIQRGAI